MATVKTIFLFVDYNYRISTGGGGGGHSSKALWTNGNDILIKTIIVQMVRIIKQTSRQRALITQNDYGDGPQTRPYREEYPDYRLFFSEFLIFFLYIIAYQLRHHWGRNS